MLSAHRGLWLRVTGDRLSLSLSTGNGKPTRNGFRTRRGVGFGRRLFR
jgi:hypothetical protein